MNEPTNYEEGFIYYRIHKSELLAFLKKYKITYDEVEGFISNLEYGCCASFDDIENMFRCNRELFFTKLSEILNRPIDHIVHEMNNVQQPDNIEHLKAITNERMSDISIEQWQKWCLKYGLTYQENKLACPVVIKNTQARRSIAIGTQCKDAIRCNVSYSNFLLLLGLKKNTYIDEHDYMNNAKEIYELVDELESM
jgi:hypothetical protein